MNAAITDTIVYRYKQSLYLNITNSCTNECVFCIKKFSKGVGKYDLRLKMQVPKEKILSEINKEINLDDKEIVFCGYGEPLTRFDTVIDVIKAIKIKYPSIKIRINTNGHANLIYPNRNIAKNLSDAGLDSISISLNSENSKKYFEICNPKFGIKSYDEVLKFIKECKKYIKVVYISIVEGYADTLECKKKADELGCKFKIR